MTIMAPKDENELARMLVTAINHDGPVALRYPRGIGAGVHIQENPKPLEMGKAQVINKGDDLLIIAIGKCVMDAVNASKCLADQDIHATIINARFVKPLDSDMMIEYARKIKKIILVEEHVLDGGFGSAVLEMFADKGVTGFITKRIGIKNQFVEHGPQDVLRKDYGIDKDAIVKAGLNLHGKTIE
jgi:1-deoxy-D-xylulose-5-phosphate synthase